MLPEYIQRLQTCIQYMRFFMICQKFEAPKMRYTLVEINFTSQQPNYSFHFSLHTVGFQLSRIFLNLIKMSLLCSSTKFKKVLCSKKYAQTVPNKKFAHLNVKSDIFWLSSKIIHSELGRSYPSETSWS